jgi:predicted nucleotidyltransferase
MKVAVPILAPVLRSDTQGKLLAEVFADPEAEHTVTSLAIRAGTSLATALREIERAEAARIVTTRRLGNTRLVRADTANPLYRPYSEIVLATYGPPAIIRQEVAGIAGIEQLYLFGSWAARYSGEAGRAPNDLDVLVVGDPDRQAVYEAAERAERRIGLPVQVTLRPERAWESSDDPFLAEIRSRPLVSLLEEDGR